MTAPNKIAAFSRDPSGTAAAEFALLFPLLVLLLLGAADISRAVQERIALGAIMRAGAEAAMRLYTKPQIELSMLAASNLTIGASTAPFNALSQADQVCACPTSPPSFSVCVDPTAPSYSCGVAEPALVYWRISASKTVNTIFLPSISFQKDILVQIR